MSGARRCDEKLVADAARARGLAGSAPRRGPAPLLAGYASSKTVSDAEELPEGSERLDSRSALDACG